ncbi:endonuclease/exonuclease/phosphatase family protein [Pseudomonas chlororaphis]|uniref:endonuclease/exonuclease/phosphatase family protein n=1 Tax=Pseudomonas TaxID=286 RepID=UPI0005BECCEF|nr:MULTISPECIES: endonuclease/exonuclease/phosphatase family protein [Pseudomonas]AJO78208.1 endonuclease/exonuclease/phosphatase [Pseudomonas sp. MRSN 12121]MCB2254182.1 endonuclease/exonuclease/phosphatase family protein [Pseudomonas chlororaphis]
MRLATYNVENLFNRAKAMNLEGWAEGKPVLEAFARLNQLLGEPTYSAQDKVRMVSLLTELGLAASDRGPFVILRQNRGSLVKRPKAGGLEIVANGRTEWVGSLELIEAPVDLEAMRNTARVMIDLKADVLAVVEAESRPALRDFNTEIIGGLGGPTFKHVMLIDGNDTRGIDVGLMTAAGYPIGTLRSHVDDAAADGELIFSRDCAQFQIPLPAPQQPERQLIVLVNHLKSKGFGSLAASAKKRQAQAERIKAIYQELVARGERYIAVVGDFNDTPDSAPLAPLLQDTDLKDAFVHPAFDDGGYPGTFDTCKAANKIDYLLLSPALFATVSAGGVWRKGMWPGSRPQRWDVYPELDKKENAGSDHAAVWVDLAL